jgi:hypothetical protein
VRVMCRENGSQFFGGAIMRLIKCEEDLNWVAGRLESLRREVLMVDAGCPFGRRRIDRINRLIGDYEALVRASYQEALEDTRPRLTLIKQENQKTSRG